MTTRTGKILIVDDDEDILYSARLLLKQHYSIVRIEKDPIQIPAILAGDSYDVILLDMNFSGGETGGSEGFNWLKKILEWIPFRGSSPDNSIWKHRDGRQSNKRWCN